MARPPEVFVRDLSIQEGRRRQRISRTAKDPVKLRRAIVVMMSAQGQSVPDITTLMQVSADYVRDVVHAFNEGGFAALDPQWSRGPAPTISTETREHIGLIARTTPGEWGIAGQSTWSLATLARHLVERGIVAAISREHLRRILREQSVPMCATATGGRDPRPASPGVHRSGAGRVIRPRLRDTPLERCAEPPATPFDPHSVAIVTYG